jgi:hypothetical protein
MIIFISMLPGVENPAGARELPAQCFCVAVTRFYINAGPVARYFKSITAFPARANLKVLV